jgi:hypothetical protein|tara:strand:+ start:61124 stop:61573 length:450 start_codon:yes stop_codon:yes gene_type:complete
MIQLNIPPQNISIKIINSNKYIFDIIRKKNIFLTPEEWVRQNIVHHLVYNYNYPKSLIKLESSLKYNNLSKRSDIIVYDKKMNIFLLVECKSYKISINESALKQVSVYNKVYKSKNIMISNGINHYVCEVNLNASRYNWIDKIPNYPLD